MAAHSSTHSHRPTYWPVFVAAAVGFAAGLLVHSRRRSTAPTPVSVREPARPAPPAASVAVPNGPAVDAANGSQSGWEALRRTSASPARDAALAASLATLAQHDPARALALAQAETGRRLRRTLLEAVLRGWGRVAPLDAGRWALATDYDFREAALTAVFSSAAASDPGAAFRAGQALCQLPGADAAGCGNHLVVALAEAGQFELAAQVASTDSAPDRNSLLGEAYSRWASYQPDRAAAAALALPDPAARLRALQGVIGGWSDNDPAAAVRFATSLPSADTDRDALASQALLRWAKTDLKGASDWINAREPSASMDQGVSAIATQDYMKPDIALSWAESVYDPALRSETVATVLRRWATSDVAAVKRYLASSPALLPDDRKELEGWITTLGGPSS